MTCKICGGMINVGRDTIVRDGDDLVHSSCMGEKSINLHIIYCANCDSGPVMLEYFEDRERTRCMDCGVYMHDAYLADEYFE